MTKTREIDLRTLRAEAKRVGCELTYDPDCQCYRATAPDGMRFDPGLHELIAVFGGGIIGNGQTHAEARTDLGERLASYAALEPCDAACGNGGPCGPW